ncbi:MAG: hypothetical protein ACYCYR_05240 [Desulfobulbaceae bacterium]
MKYTAIFNKSIELHDFYGCFIWKMKGRSCGRSTIHIENILFAEFILNYIDQPFWEYPVTIHYEDRPDFFLQSKAGKIGIEITEQKSANFGQALSMLESSNGWMSHTDFAFSENEKKLKGRHVAQLVSKTLLTGAPSMGHREEENWVKRTLDTMKDKEIKYKQYPNWNQFKDNLLIIFDVRPESIFFEDVTTKMLEPLYSYGKLSIFSSIHCLDSNFVTIDLKSQSFKFRESHKGSSK